MKNKIIKGFTLVELIIVMALMAILMLMVGMMFKPIAQLFADSTKYTEDRYVMDGINSYLQENLKYADNVAIVYDYAAFNVSADYIKDYTCCYNGLNDKDVQCISIVNVYDGLANHPATDFTDNNGYYNSCRIYKSAYLPGATTRTEWLVGGEAFYGGSSYFVNLETSTAAGNLLPAGDFEYTIYSFDKTKTNKVASFDMNDYTTQGNIFTTMRNQTRDNIKLTTYNDYISNFLSGGVRFINSAKTDFTGVVCDAAGNRMGFKYPVDGDMGAYLSDGNAVDNHLVTNPGYNIYILYTVPQ